MVSSWDAAFDWASETYVNKNLWVISQEQDIQMTLLRSWDMNLWLETLVFGLQGS